MGVLFAIMGHGMASTMAPMTAAVMNAVGPQRAGLGSATTNSSREVGGVFGIALLGTILFTRLESVLAPSLAGLGLSPRQQATITSAAGHGQLDVGALGLDPNQAAAVGRAFGDAFLSGFRLALVVAGLAVGGGGSSEPFHPRPARGVRARPRRGAPGRRGLTESELAPRLAASLHGACAAHRLGRGGPGARRRGDRLGGQDRGDPEAGELDHHAWSLRRAPEPLPPGDARIDALRASGPRARDLRPDRHAHPAGRLDRPDVPRLRGDLLGPRRRDEHDRRARALRLCRCSRSGSCGRASSG